MRVTYLQHVPFEGLGSMEAYLGARGHSITPCPLYLPQELPTVADFDLLIAMGGPMSVNDEREFPWLVEEKRLVRAAVNAGKPFLGICLGAQLLAAALGGKVFPNREREIGWHPIYAPNPKALRHPVGRLFAQPIPVFHWHGETIDLPADGVHLARSEGCMNQAFIVGAKALGLQFHLETTAESAAKLLEHCAGDLKPGRYVQTPAQIQGAPAQFASINAVMEQVLDYLTA